MYTYVTTEVETKKRTNSSSSLANSRSTDTIPERICRPIYDFSVMVCDIAQILQRYDGALERMLITFEQMAIVMKSMAYTALINSREYSNINSVRTLFRLLAPYWKPVDCSLLVALVKATECEAAIRRHISEAGTKREKMWYWVKRLRIRYQQLPQVKMLQLLPQSFKSLLQMEIPPLKSL